MDQLVVWENCIVGVENATRFKEHFAKEGFNVEYQCEYKTLPTPGEPNTGGRNDVIFTIKNKDIPKFSLWRLAHGMRWWEDYLDNGSIDIVPKEILKQYPYGWETQNG